jgi:hypothetical protein
MVWMIGIRCVVRIVRTEPVGRIERIPWIKPVHGIKWIIWIKLSGEVQWIIRTELVHWIENVKVGLVPFTKAEVSQSW